MGNEYNFQLLTLLTIFFSIRFLHVLWSFILQAWCGFPLPTSLSPFLWLLALPVYTVVYYYLALQRLQSRTKCHMDSMAQKHCEGTEDPIHEPTCNLGLNRCVCSPSPQASSLIYTMASGCDQQQLFPASIHSECGSILISQKEDVQALLSMELNSHVPWLFWGLKSTRTTGLFPLTTSHFLSFPGPDSSFHDIALGMLF